METEVERDHGEVKAGGEFVGWEKSIWELLLLRRASTNLPRQMSCPLPTCSFLCCSDSAGLETRKPDLPVPCCQTQSFCPLNQLLHRNE